MTLEKFFSILATIENDEALEDFCRKHVLHGIPHIFIGREEDFYEFRKRIAEKFSVSFHEIYITGSAKLGFSPFKNTEFNLDSDIDVAIVSQTLFDLIMEIIRNYQMNLRTNRRTVTTNEIAIYHKFLEYTAIGWIRPDKLPYSFRVYSLKTDWFDFFNSLSNGRSEVGNYKVTAGVFRTYRHLELYSFSNIKRLKSSISLEREK